jgi:hypothetical protein
MLTIIAYSAFVFQIFMFFEARTPAQFMIAALMWPIVFLALRLKNKGDDSQ